MFQFLGLGREVGQLGLAFVAQGSLVEVEQRISSDRDFFRGGLHCGDGGLGRFDGRRFGDGGGGLLADFLGHQVLVAEAADRQVAAFNGRAGREFFGPVAGAPAQTGAAARHDEALVDGVGNGLGVRIDPDFLLFSVGCDAEAESRDDRQEFVCVFHYFLDAKW